MAGALGFGLSALLQAGLGYEREQHNKKLIQQQNEAALFHDIATKHPEVIVQSPEMQKSFKKFYGDDALGLVMGVGQAAQHAQQQAGSLFSRGAPSAGGAPNPMAAAPTLPPSASPSAVPSGMRMVPTGLPPGITPEALRAMPEPQAEATVRALVSGGGAPAAATAPPFEGAHPSVAAVWDDASAMRDMLDKADAFMSSPEYQYLDEGHRKAIDKRYELFSKRLAELEKEDREFSPSRAKAKGAFESTVEAATRGGKVETEVAKERATRPEKAATAAATTTATKKAGLAPDIVAGEATAAGERTKAEAKAKAEVAATTPTKWTAKDALEARSKALAQAKTELTVPGRLFGTTAPPPKMLQRRAREILLNEGLNPDTGMQLKAGDTITDPKTGKTLKWVP